MSMRKALADWEKGVTVGEMEKNRPYNQEDHSGTRHSAMKNMTKEKRRVYKIV